MIDSICEASDTSLTLFIVLEYKFFFYISFALRFSILDNFLLFGFEFHISLIFGELSLHIERDFHDFLGDETLHKITFLGLLLVLYAGTIYFFRLSCSDIVEYFILVDWVVDMKFLHL